MYSSDIRDKEWLILAPFIAQGKMGRPRTHDIYTGLIYQDKFSLILLPFLYVAFKRHFVNNHDKHSWVFDTQY